MICRQEAIYNWIDTAQGEVKDQWLFSRLTMVI
jgi:hypothetical protein